MKKILPLFLTLITTSVFSQNCDGNRYINNVFSSVTVTEDIKYGEGYEINGTFKELYLDVYEPTNDSEKNRPVIIIAFGGSFIGGNRKDVDWLCESYAQRGYVAVSIDYRLYDGSLFPIPTDIQMQEVVIKAVSDFKGAIRYLRNDATNGNTFNINSEIILVGGISSGSIAASHTAVLDSTDTVNEELQAIINENGGLEGMTNDLFEYSTEVQGLINFSGGLASASMIDSDDPTFFSVHDEFDDIVPYEEGFASVFGVDIIYMEGSKKMKEAADSVGLKNQLVTFEGSTIHVGYFLEPSDDTIIENVITQSAIFAENIVCELATTTSHEKRSKVQVYPNPTHGILRIGKDDSIYDLRLMDISGRTVESWSGVNQVNLQSIANGFYHLKTIDSAGEITYNQIIINK